MFKRILVPVDGSETSTRALVTALQLARDAGGRLRIVHVLDEMAFITGYDYGADLMRIAHEQAEKVVEDAMAIARASGVPVDSRLIEVPAQRLGDIVDDEAESWEADLIVVGTHGRRGVSRTVLGSGAEQVIRTARIPVLSIRGSDASTR
jgi:nucleotide-binding universal stress UspA family protein